MSTRRNPASIRCLLGWLAVAVSSLGHGATAGEGRYLQTDEFLRIAFEDAEPGAAMLWIDDALRERIEDIVDHPFAALRVRYWQDGGRTAWILDEIGKERPITIGVSVVDGAVELVRVLEFREPRGWEVRHAFFTDQFAGARVTAEQRFDRDIDGITGATLSVAAVTRVVRLALFLSEVVRSPHS